MTLSLDKCSLARRFPCFFDFVEVGRSACVLGSCARSERKSERFYMVSRGEVDGLPRAPSDS